MQLGLNYRGGPLSVDERGTVPEGVTQAGDRAPDAQLKDATGKPCRLFDAFRGPHFTLLALGGAELPRLDGHGDAVRAYRIVRPNNAISAADGNVLIDIEDQAHRIYGDGLVLVRPDGYVGYTGTGRDGAAGLRSYLARFFG
jgi:hypothetical protein